MHWHRASADPPRSPTTTGKIERFHRSLRAEFLNNAPAFTNLKTAQQALDEWVDYYNNSRPHQSLNMATPAEKFAAGARRHPDGRRAPRARIAPAITGSAAG